jgi:hypothetical protein
MFLGPYAIAKHGRRWRVERLLRCSSSPLTASPPAEKTPLAKISPKDPHPQLAWDSRNRVNIQSYAPQIVGKEAINDGR